MVALLTGISIALVAGLILAMAGARRLRTSVTRLSAATRPGAGGPSPEDG